MHDLHSLTALADRGRRLVAKHRPAGVTARADRWYEIRAAEGGRTTLRLYGYIGDDWDGVTASTLLGQLDTIGSSGIDLHINSGGGSVFDGVAIYTALKNHPSDVVSHVDSLAASAASFVAMAGDEIVMEKPAKMMIHDASGLTLGNAADHREMADLLDELSNTIAGIYADRAGGDVAGWRDAMRTTSWYSATQAVEAGLADRVAGAPADSSTTNAPQDRRTQLIRARARVTLGRV